MPATRKLDFCPFCGGRPDLKVKSIMGDKKFKVACTKEKCFIQPETKFFDTETAACWNWNDRYCENNQARKNLLWDKRMDIRAVLYDHERLCRSGHKKLQLNRVLFLLKILKGALDGRGAKVKEEPKNGEHLE
jgi:hypothetical protein